MKSYLIRIKTNPYQASRNIMFKKHRTEAILADKLTLNEAKEKLLNFFRDDYKNESVSNYAGWPQIFRHSRNVWSLDGLFGYEHDGYYYQIIEDERQRGVIEDFDDHYHIIEESGQTIEGGFTFYEEAVKWAEENNVVVLTSFALNY